MHRQHVPGSPWSTDRVQILLEELETMRVAAREQERLVVQGYGEMDRMLAEVEKQRNEVSRQSEAMERAHGALARIVDTMEEVLLVVDADGLISMINRRLLELTGYGSAELMGHSPDQLFVPEQLAALGRVVELPYRTDQPIVYQLFSARKGTSLDGDLVCKGGELLPTMFRSAPLYSPKGKKEGLVLVGSDMREIRAGIARLDAAGKAMRLVLDNVKEGLVTVDSNGLLSAERSRPMEQWFGVPRSETTLWEYLFDKESLSVATWLELAWGEAFSGFLPVELTLDQLPKRFQRDGRDYSLGYVPIESDGQLMRILVSVADRTEELARERSELAQKDLLAALSKSLKDRQGFHDFFKEVDSLVAGLSAPDGDLVVLKRAVHTIKGNCAVFDVMNVARTCHEVESHIADLESAPTAADLAPVVEVWGAFAAKIKPLVGIDEAGTLTVDPTDYQSVLAKVKHRNRYTEIAGLLEAWPHEPASRRLERIGGQIEALAGRWGMPAPRVEIDAGNFRFPVEEWAELWGVYPHVYRNALDHGIEGAEEREAIGKPAAGRVRLAATLRSGEVVIELEDDGRGIDWERIRQKAIAMNLPHDAQVELTDALFADGVSSREVADDRSGRGVGLSAVRYAAEALGGRIEVESVKGLGTVFRMVFPSATIWIPPARASLRPL